MEGIINILKPPGPTSFDVVYLVRKKLNIKKAGHLGTLDPGACGVLPIMIGRATRFFDLLHKTDKEYIVRMTFGTGTDTLDALGKVVRKLPFDFSETEFIETLKSFKGKISQVPPSFSAVHVNGKRAYDLARAGVEFELKPRTVEIKSIDYLKRTDGSTFMFKVCCSSGTYIRSLVEDIAKKLNTAAYMSFLLRTKSCGFGIDSAITLQELDSFKSEYLTTLDELARKRPFVIVKEQYTKALYNGNKLLKGAIGEDCSNGSETFCVFDSKKRFVAFATLEEDIIRINKLFLTENFDEGL